MTCDGETRMARKARKTRMARGDNSEKEREKAKVVPRPRKRKGQGGAKAKKAKRPIIGGKK